MKSPHLSPPSPLTPLTTTRLRRTLERTPLPPSSQEKTVALAVTPPSTPSPQPSIPLTTTIKRKRSLFSDSQQWKPLNVPRTELSLPITLPTGQTFRWRQTSPFQYTGVVGSHLLSLKHLESDPDGTVAFLHHNPNPNSNPQLALREYLNLDISLAEMWRGFSESDSRFAELARRFDGGARVLRQDPVECVFQFLCSSNNNIGRIEKMVRVISSFGDYLGSVGGFDFHKFPSIERLSLVSEQQLRNAGFGYRAKYVVGAVRALQSKPGGGAEWLESLRRLELAEVIDELCTLPGVGPKVAACIALFSLDQHHAIPVDTHVWQIATRYFIPELAGARLTPKLFGQVSEAFVARFGKYAGWAQTVLFIGELPSGKEKKPTRRPGKKSDIAVEVSTECKITLKSLTVTELQFGTVAD